MRSVKFLIAAGAVTLSTAAAFAADLPIAAPPMYAPPPPAYYAPPPVVYGAGVGINLPGVSINIH